MAVGDLELSQSSCVQDSGAWQGLILDFTEHVSCFQYYGWDPSASSSTSQRGCFQENREPGIIALHTLNMSPRK
eukprot:533199-Hanusia_phi.AAC.1